MKANTEIIRTTNVLYKGLEGKLVEGKITQREGTANIVRYYTHLYLSSEYYMTVSCGNITGSSKQAIQNRNCLKHQYGIEILKKQKS